MSSQCGAAMPNNVSHRMKCRFIHWMAENIPWYIMYAIFSVFSHMGLFYLLTYACLLAGSIGHRPRNATVFCPWPSSPFLSWCIPSPSFLFPCLFARCFVAYLFVSSLGGSMGWLDGWWCLVVSWVYVLSTSIFSSLFHFLWVVAWSFSRVTVLGVWKLSDMTPTVGHVVWSLSSISCHLQSTQLKLERWMHIVDRFISGQL